MSWRETQFFRGVSRPIVAPEAVKRHRGAWIWVFDESMGHDFARNRKKVLRDLTVQLAVPRCREHSITSGMDASLERAVLDVREDFLSADVERQIDAMTPTRVHLERTAGEIIVRCNFVMSMADGKVVSTLTGMTFSHACYICGQTSAAICHLSDVPPVKPENLRFGLATLHAWIRLFEYLLKLAYRIGLAGEIPPKAPKQLKRVLTAQHVKKRKTAIQSDFRRQQRLLVDLPKQNFGSTNDGNTARHFFPIRSPLRASPALTKLSRMNDSRVLLPAIFSECHIDADIVEQHAAAAKLRLLTLYPDANMTPAVHKVLDHGADIQSLSAS